MQVMTSYFYQIRNFSPNMIPLSTALSDPKWFHQGKGKKYQFKDKNNVWNGLRAEPFVPGPMCNTQCSGKPCPHNPKTCSFLKNYRKQLDKLNFKNIWFRLERLGSEIKEIENFSEEPILVLIVHEAYDNPCSERWVIQDWFKANGYEIKEFNKE